jgi:hypothetical protein
VEYYKKNCIYLNGDDDFTNLWSIYRLEEMLFKRESQRIVRMWFSNGNSNVILLTPHLIILLPLQIRMESSKRFYLLLQGQVKRHCRSRHYGIYSWLLRKLHAFANWNRVDCALHHKLTKSILGRLHPCAETGNGAMRDAQRINLETCSAKV